jgi:hypothetical protein
MKRTLLILVILGIVLMSFHGCGGDSSTSPDGEEETPLAVDTVGTNGGTFEIEDFALIVPAGAFDSDVELRLYEATEDHGFGSNYVSRYFRLEGLPDSLSDSLAVRIQYTGTLSGETLVAHGQKDSVFDDYGEGSELTFFSIYPASESSGYLEAVIPPRAGEESLSALRPRVGRNSTVGYLYDYFIAIDSYERRLKSDHVKISYPLDVIDYVDDFVRYIEDAHDTVVSVGIGYEGKYWKWPVEVVVQQTPPPYKKVLAVHSTSKKSGKFIIQINEPEVRPSNLPTFRRGLARIMVLAAQSIPEPVRLKELNRISWDNAIRCWIEEKFVDPGSFTRPNDFGGMEKLALAGLPIGHGDSELAAKHGQGWSPVVEYLTRRYGDKLVGDIYRQVQTEYEKPVHALLDLIPDPAHNWWPQFVDRYLNGHVYDVDSYVFLLSIPSYHTYTIRSAADTLAVFTRSSHHVSAELYRITPDYALIPEDAQMELSITCRDVSPDYLTLLVYKLKDGAFTYIGGGSKVCVPNVYDLTIDGYEIVVASVLSYNEEPYTDTEFMTTEMRIITPPQYNRCRLNIGNLKAHFKEVDDNGDGTDYWDDEWYSEWEGKGSWDGNTFTASWSGRYEPTWGTTSGHLEVVLDPNTHDVLSFTGSRVIDSHYGYVATDSISGNTIEFNEETTIPNPFLDCKVMGSTVCDRIAYTYRRTYTEPAKIEEIDEYVCQAKTALYATFWYSEGE